jgi:UDP-glucose 4-epimerase
MSSPERLGPLVMTTIKSLEADPFGCAQGRLRRFALPERRFFQRPVKRQVLGWNPQHSEIESIVRSAWEWHKANPQARA